MAIARVTVPCSTCGKEFEATRYCRNRTEADEWEEWVEATGRECPDCYKARKQEELHIEAGKICERLHLPEITEGTEKQIQYANNLRDRYLVDYELFSWKRNLAIVKKRLANGSWQKTIADLAESKGSFPDNIQYEELKRGGIEKLVVLATTNEAHTIIDLLRYDPFDSDMIRMIDKAIRKLETESKENVAAIEEGEED